MVGQVGVAPTFPCSQDTDLHGFDLCPDMNVPFSKMADATGAAPAISGSTDRQLCCSLSRPWWELVESHHSSTSGLLDDGGFTDR